MDPEIELTGGYDGNIGESFNDEEVESSPVALSWVKSRVKTQNRCFLCAITLFLIIPTVYVFGGVSVAHDNNLAEEYSSEHGIVADGYDHPKTEYTYPGGKKGHASSNWFQGNKDKDFFGNVSIGELGSFNRTENAQAAANARWNRTHPGQSRKDRCEQLPKGWSEWLDSNITKKDGVKYEIVKQIDHDAEAFTQGLTYDKGVLYESTGLYGESTVRILNSETAEVIESVAMDKALFGEGMAVVGTELYQITWKSKRGFIYNTKDLKLAKEFTYKTTNGQGWGITFDECRKEFIVSDGTHFLHFWDVKTLGAKRKIAVFRKNGQKATQINEIEFWRGRVLANVWFEDVILVINPKSGVVEMEYDFSQLWPQKERENHGAGVLNGISISEDPDVLYITGKKWDRIFKIKLL